MYYLFTKNHDGICDWTLQDRYADDKKKYLQEYINEYCLNCEIMVIRGKEIEAKRSYTIVE